MLGEWVRKVCDAWAKIHQELLLTDVVLYPMVTFIHGFGSLGLASLIGVTVSHCVVDLKGS